MFVDSKAKFETVTSKAKFSSNPKSIGNSIGIFINLHVIVKYNYTGKLIVYLE